MTDSGGALNAPPPTQSLVAAALKRWAQSLVDMTGNNQLLYCRSAAKLSLDAADQTQVSRLLDGKKVRTSDLFPAADQSLTNALKLMRDRIKEYDQDRGIRVGRLVDGFATWDDGPDRTPRAPVLLRHVTINQPVPGVPEFELVAEADLEVNPVMLHALTARVSVSTVVLDQIVEAAHTAGTGTALRLLDRHMTGRVDGWTTMEGRLLGTFQYANLPMVADLTDHVALFESSALVKAMAGDPDAVTLLRQTGQPIDRGMPDRTPPVDEFLVLDADPSQNYAINAALAGHNIIVQGPPGNGKSQTIANTIAAATARGKTVLFVAEKRAAIDAVLSRLTDVGLDSLVLDLHDGASQRRRINDNIRAALTSAGQTPPTDLSLAHTTLTNSRDALNASVAALHKVREPWGTSVAHMQQRLTEVAAFTVDARLTGAALNEMTPAAADDIRSLLHDIATNRGFATAAERGPWAVATTLTSEQDVLSASHVAHTTQTAVDALIPIGHGIADAVHLRRPATVTQCADLAALLVASSEIVPQWTMDALTADVAPLIAATGDRRYRKTHAVSASWGDRRRALKAARALRANGPSDRAQVHAALIQLQELKTAWATASTQPGNPVQHVNADTFSGAVTAAQDAAAQLATITHTALDDHPLAELSAWLHQLTADLAGLNRVRSVNLATAALPHPAKPALSVIAHATSNRPLEQHPAVAASVFDAYLFGSVMDYITLTDPVIGGFDATTHTAIATTFADADRTHRDTTPARIRRLHAERITQARTEHPKRDQHLEKELGKKRQAPTIRTLLHSSSDLLLTAKPCWMMSPLAVSQVLPDVTMFDLVIFDEASQIRPAEAIPALGRARTAVVAGDSQQLPPSNFFNKVLHAEDATAEEEAENTAYTDGMESLLDTMNAVLGDNLAHEYYLRWHYRSQDARLIAFSNTWFYGNRLVTFPGTHTDPPVRLEHVAPDPTATGPASSATAEVQRVIDLVIDHATNRPQESLGVIAAGIRHAKRLQDALNDRLRNDPHAEAVRDYFNETHHDEFFIKNLERVQGDERDAIILTTGYGPDAHGKLTHRFGPISEAGGERRLNVAVTRARKRLTVVASFTADDLDPTRMSNDGGKRLRSYLQYAASGGRELGEDAPANDRAMNPFEQHIHDRLTAAGIPVIPQYGVSGYWLDFAAPHPKQPGRMVLAIEADGASYHSTETARARDRLRQEHLERLGWRFHRIWSRAWFTDPDGETRRALDAYDKAVADADAERSTQHPTPPAPPTVAPTAAPQRNRICPVHGGGQPITTYSDLQLAQLMDWIASDGLLRTPQELVDAAVEQLGYKRRGSTIKQRLTTAAQRHLNAQARRDQRSA